MGSTTPTRSAHNAVVDLRSDTVTRPTDGMRQAMATAEVGDDVYGEDPTVRALEQRLADHFGRQAALYVPSGIMATQVLLASLCPRGSEVVCAADAHVVAYESGAAAIVANVQFHTLVGDRGRLTPQAVASSLRPTMFPYTPASVLSVEETTNRGGGAIYGLDWLHELRALADERGLVLHGDGARMFNAIVARRADPAAYGAVFTAFSVCLSKGLGAPLGSVVVGDEEVIAEASLWRRRLGGAMRQAGIVAAAGLYALDHHVDRLAEDHANARLIAERIVQSHQSAVDLEAVETNIVYVDTGATSAQYVVDESRRHGVLVGAMGERLIRLVTHLDVDRSSIDHAAEVIIAALDRG